MWSITRLYSAFMLLFAVCFCISSIALGVGPTQLHVLYTCTVVVLCVFLQRAAVLALQALY